MALNFLAAVLTLALAQPAQVGPPAPAPRAAPSQDCRPSDNPEEMVVCGERYDENSPYRVPQQFRNQRSDNDAHSSWDARTRDLEALERFSDQTVGPSGAFRHSRQVDCEWRVARQQARGERPDCGTGLPF